MTTPHRATPEQWAAIEAAASPREIGHGVTMHHAITVVAAGLVDIRARIEALEQLHQAVVDLNEQFSLEPLVARIEALEAAQQLATTEESSAVQGDDHQSLHTVALGMVDTLERLGVLPEAEGPTDEEWDALKERLWGKYEVCGYMGERFIYEGDFCTALDLARQELARWGRPSTTEN